MATQATVLVAGLVATLVLLALLILRGWRARKAAERTIAFERAYAGDLLAQAEALDRLVAAVAGLGDDLDEGHVLVRAAGEACRLVGADLALALEHGSDGALSVVASAPERRGWQPLPLRASTPDAAAAELVRLHGGAALAVPLSAPSLRLGMLAVVRGGDEPFTPLEIAQFRVLCNFAARAAQNARLFTLAESLREEAEERQRERGRLSDRLLHAEEGERRRLALALHDGPQQTMAGIGLMLQAVLASIEVDDDEEARRVIQIAANQTREVGRSLRRLSFALEPITLRDHGFTAAFGELAAQVAESHGLAVAVDAAAVDELDRQAQVCLYRIAQEALANAVKHSRGSRVDVVAELHGDGAIELTVADDGHGAKNDALARGGLHRGVDAMRERALGIDATLTFERTSGGGTTVRVLVPRRPAMNAPPSDHVQPEAA